jgi:hypothetical protein
MTAIRQSKPRLEGHKPSKTFGEFSPVTLTIPVTYRGVTFPKGARGVVVHQHDDGIGYEVEFETPMQAVLTLTSEQIQ